MNKKILADMFGIDTHEQELKQKDCQLDILADQVAYYKVKAESLEKELAFHRLNDEEKLLIMRADIQGLEDTYSKRILEYNEMIELAKQDADIAEQKIHKAFADGRIAAFSEVGIWRLDALESGNRLVLDKDGNVYELLQDLEDVDYEHATLVEIKEPLKDEIIIDDLAEL